MAGVVICTFWINYELIVIGIRRSVVCIIVVIVRNVVIINLLLLFIIVRQDGRIVSLLRSTNPRDE